MSSQEQAIAFLEAWRAGQTSFTIHSSGSTGDPKPIVLERQWMIWSAEASAEIFKPKMGDALFCCLPLDKVGGLMMLVRSDVWGIPITIDEPSANPLLKDVEGNIISLTPYQIHHIIKNEASCDRLLQFREVLIGGASINSELELQLQELSYNTIFRHSYGMSETYSHVAMRCINGKDASDYYTPLRDVKVEAGLDNCATIFTPYFPEGLHTNDIIETDALGRFKVIGRADFIINSGGVKISTEMVEKLIADELKTDNPFIISSVKDPVLGEKIVLVCTNQEKFKYCDWSFLDNYSPYAKPKDIIQLRDIPINRSGKVDRLKVKAILSGED